MPYADVADFLTQLRERFSFGRLALEFLILTAARSKEVREASWDEVDLKAGLWTVPASRMKARREHVVPLSREAVAVLKKAETMRLAGNDLIFPSSSSRRAMSDMTLLKVLRDGDRPFHVHGFRSSFRDWVSEETSHSGDVAEAALAHTVANKVEGAYRRGNLLEKRRAMMDAWGAYCTGGRGMVIKLASTG